VNIGVVDFTSITPQMLKGLTYLSTPITGNNDASNKLVPGNVFAVITNQGNYAKVKVISYGYDLQIQWVTYHFNPAYVVLGAGYSATGRRQVEQGYWGVKEQLSKSFHNGSSLDKQRQALKMAVSTGLEDLPANGLRTLR
jgi:ABC-type phosphonate transport system ATPase subunit